MENPLYLTVISGIIGVFAIFIYSQIAVRKELRLRKKGYKPSKYENKLPHEYTKSQKRFTLIITVFLLLVGLLSFYFALNKRLFESNVVLVLGIVLWRVLIKVGNRVK